MKQVHNLCVNTQIIKKKEKEKKKKTRVFLKIAKLPL